MICSYQVYNDYHDDDKCNKEATYFFKVKEKKFYLNGKHIMYLCEYHYKCCYTEFFSERNMKKFFKDAVFFDEKHFLLLTDI